MITDRTQIAVIVMVNADKIIEDHNHHKIPAPAFAETATRRQVPSTIKP